MLGVAPLAIAVLLLFWNGDDAISASFRSDLAQWLKGLRVPELTIPWVGIVAQQFRRVFGAKHLSWRCFRTSSIYSIVFLLVLYISIALATPDPLAHTHAEFIVYLIGYGAFFLPFNVLLDYISLLKSRSLIERIESNRLSAATALILDILSTAVFVMLVVLGAMYLMEYVNGWGNSPAFDDATELVLDKLLGNVGPGFSNSRLFGFYLSGWQVIALPPALTTFLTVLWTGSAFLGSLFIRYLARAERALHVAKYVLPVEDQPVRTVGIGAALMVAIITLSTTMIGFAFE